MARKPTSQAKPSAETRGAPKPPIDRRASIIEALMSLLTTHSLEQIELDDLAEAAGITLAELRDEFGSTLSVLAAHAKSLDRQVLSEMDSDMAEESPRERLFDVLMRRLELLNPHREAIRSLLRTARRNPPLGLALNSLAVRSQQWMLTAAGIDAAGVRGMLRAQGLALLFANVLRTWVDDEDDNTLTLAMLDRELARGQRFAGLLDDLYRIPQAACNLRRRMTPQPRRRRGDPDDMPLPI